jgi:hypothetical protein
VVALSRDLDDAFDICLVGSLELGAGFGIFVTVRSRELDGACETLMLAVLVLDLVCGRDVGGSWGILDRY